MTHGTRQAYKAGCACCLCKAANAAYERDYRRLKADGKVPMGAKVSAKDVARRITEIRAEGISRAAIAKALGLKRPILELHTGPGAKITMRNLLRLKRLHAMVTRIDGPLPSTAESLSLRLHNRHPS